MAAENLAAVFIALQIPPAVLERGGVEVLRAIVVDGDLHVALRRAFDDPDPWGMLIADITRHIARIYGTESNLTPDQVIERVRTIYDAEMDQPTDPSTTTAVS
jgi:hypothetical protein